MINLIKRLKQYPKIGQTPDANQQSDINAQIENMARRMAADIVAQQQQLATDVRNGRIYNRFDNANDVINNQKEIVTAGLWSDNLASLTTYHTSSTQTTSQRKYYVDVLQDLPANDGAAVQFSIAYGHALGSGSDSTGQLEDSPSKAVYSQYKQLLLTPGDNRFTTAGSGSTEHIYVINFKRNRLKERLDPGNWELPMSKVSARNANATGSVTIGSGVIQLIDDSSVTSAAYGESGRVYNVVSGSLNDGIWNPTAPHYYGLVYPDHGIVVLDGKMLDQKLSTGGIFSNTGSSSEGNNHFALYRSISGSGLFVNPDTSDAYGFSARNSETITSTHYFVRVKNAEYNFSNNSSYTTGSLGAIAQSTFISDPKTYITTVGLYNDRQELLAIAKLSKPLLKSFQREALIRVKLDF